MDDAWWKENSKTHVGLLSLWHSPILFEEELEMIFGRDIANGELLVNPNEKMKKKKKRLLSKRSLSSDFSNDALQQPREDTADSGENVIENDSPPKPCKEGVEDPTKRKQRIPASVKALSDGLFSVANVLKVRSDKTDLYSPTACMEMCRECGLTLGTDEWVEATRRFEPPAKMEIFYVLGDVESRRRWHAKELAS